MNENTIIIGSSGRNSGKTSLAKFLINKWRGEFPIAALKVTCIDNRSSSCPRIGQSCGACSSLGGQDFLLEKERGNFPEKDTAQLLSAGADYVFWLRSLRSALHEGYCAFLERIPRGSLVICESNSLREVIKPACFIMLIDHRYSLEDDCPSMKLSASRVCDLADITALNFKKPQDFQRILNQIHIEKNEIGDINIKM